MNFTMGNKQKGATLLVGMIMLVVLTLLVVFAIRSGNTNLKIAGNMQAQTEVSAATQQVIEQVIEQIKLPATDISQIKAQTFTVPAGNASYTVTVQAMSDKCLVEVPVLNADLNPTNPNDVPCFESPDEDKAITATGQLTTKPSACKTQQWEIEAGVTDVNSGAKATQLQGITIRVPATVTCL
jgi:Tfp pilus assembly protein PilX